jgi:hypothetical protein
LIAYEKVMKTSRGKDRLAGHCWRCNECGQIVHSESRIDFEETGEQAAARLARIKAATEGHKCR